jgi:hypothetical protein
LPPPTPALELPPVPALEPPTPAPPSPARLAAPSALLLPAFGSPCESSSELHAASALDKTASSSTRQLVVTQRA